ncbi:AI-2E family transporter [Curtobacterium ammoniigenes]|uniref:AI-2E family transporter n=1 Tax=Curtobacterium ammoniigenes TaxID=395387 RepID=UPI00082DF7FE|nr:AI-2E family transporter [Curtobacterium ammoniigenes]
MPFRLRSRAVPPTESTTEDAVPAGVRIAGAFSWNILVVVAILVVVGIVIIRLQDVVVPFLIAIILSALLVPLARWLQRHHWPKWAAILTSWIVVLAALAAMTVVVTAQVRYDIPSLQRRVQHTVNSAKSLLATHPFGITGNQIDKWVNDGTTYLQGHASSFASGFAAAGTSAIHVFEGLFIIIFTTLFVLIDGGRIWAWVVRVFPRRARRRIEAAGEAGWRTLTSFVRVQLIVAVTDGVAVGVGSFLTGVPLAIPIGVIVFLGAFVPVVGAIVAGIFAVIVALVFNGWIQALIVLGIVILVQELESHVLHPFLTGSAVKVHPLGIVLGVTAGSSIAGIAGAFFAVPFIATANAMIVAAAHADPDELTGAGHDSDPDERAVEVRSRR